MTVANTNPKTWPPPNTILTLTDIVGLSSVHPLIDTLVEFLNTSIVVQQK